MVKTNTNELVTVLESHGKLSLCSYAWGYYTIERLNHYDGETLFSTDDETEARNCFSALKEQLSAKDEKI